MCGTEIANSNAFRGQAGNENAGRMHILFESVTGTVYCIPAIYYHVAIAWIFNESQESISPPNVLVLNVGSM